ncbi:MAG TPA: hypothetical protein VM598_00505 [Bdellovibrionota bacterium]|nr:hypothetical protein [Bdellovibrionota bacterium]
MSRRVETGAWLPLMDYSMRKGVSLSTLRRHIKAGKVQFKVEEGRYLLFDEEAEQAPAEAAQTAHETSQLRFMVSRLELELKSAREEIAELKTLIALYEETPPPARTEHTQALDL